MKLKSITDKLLRGDFLSLLNLTEKGKLHPAEVAKVLNSLPADSLYNAFTELSFESQVDVFSYLDPLAQKRLVEKLPKENAQQILNSISSDDRLSLFSILNPIELAQYLEYLNEENRKTTLDFLGFPKQSIARLINTDFATINKGMTLGEAVDHLRKSHPDTEVANYI